MNTPRENSEMNIPQEQHERLCAYVFGELSSPERTAFEAELAGSPELQAERARLEATIGLVKQAIPDAALSSDARRDLLASARRSRFRVLRGRGLATLAAVFVALLGGALALRHFQGQAATGGTPRDRLARAELPEAETLYEKKATREADRIDSRPSGSAGRSAGENEPHAYDLGLAGEPVADVAAQTSVLRAKAEGAVQDGPAVVRDEVAAVAKDLSQAEAEQLAALGYAGGGAASPPASSAGSYRGASDTVAPGRVAPNEVAAGTEGWFLGQGARPPSSASGPTSPGPGGPGAPGAPAPRAQGGPADTRSPELAAGGRLVAPPAREDLEGLRGLGYVGEGASGSSKEERQMLDLGYTAGDDGDDSYDESGTSGWFLGGTRKSRQPVPPTPEQITRQAERLCGLARLQAGETLRDMFFRYWGDNPFVPSEQDALSTFAVDVDTASYTLTRAYLKRGQLPPREAVRTEEFVNYFRADQPAPNDGSPFAIGLELAPTPFTPDARTELLRVTVRAKDVADFERQPLALTFVIDVSGSMAGERIGFVKEALTTLLGQLYAGDSVAIVAFSNTSREVSPMVSAGNRGPLEQAIGALETGGGTNVEGGLRQGYALAAGALTRNAVNRVILCSDGVGNIGETKGDALLALVAEQRARGIYLNTVGVGMGNHNDAFLEQLADKGDGLCQYVDSAAEARKVFGQDLAKALQPVARDVKIQVEFDPAQVEAWRQIGYENRALRHEDFRNDRIDAGEVNAGHQVSALYEVVRNAGSGGPLATVRLRYKPPFPVDRGDTSALGRVESEAAREIERVISFADSRPGFAAGSPGFRRSAVAAQFAEVLRRSQHARHDSLAQLVDQAQALASQTDDPEVSELAELIAKARPLVEQRAQQETPRLENLLDELARLHYERGQRERKRIEVAPEVLEREKAEIERLEAEVRQALGQQYGVELPQAPEPLRRLDELGYGGDDRRR